MQEVQHCRRDNMVDESLRAEVFRQDRRSSYRAFHGIVDDFYQFCLCPALAPSAHKSAGRFVTHPAHCPTNSAFNYY
ncbi:hypothetical protein D3C87_2020410 [compost metagenome]